MYIDTLEERVFRSTVISLLLFTTFATESIALTSGPTQPEYGAFTPSNQDGMVDLYSGDFTYSIPLMTVPGPSLSYPLTLGYRAGIQLEQEATMVGLGWTLNPGAINRSVNRYPDDYYRGQSISTMRGDNVIDGWDASIGVSYGGFGLTANVGYRSDLGYRGGLDINAGGSSINLVDYNQRDGFGTQNYQQGSFGFKALDMVMSQAMQITGGYMKESMGMSLTPQKGGVSASSSSGASFGFGSSSVNVGAFHSKSSGFSIGCSFIHAGYRKYSYWLANKEINKLYGYLDLSEMPEEAGGGYTTKTHRMEYQFSPELSRKQLEGTDDLINFFSRLKAFAVSTEDGYTVHSEGYNASIKPYRQDVADYFGMDRHEGNVPEWIDWVDNQWFGGFFQWWTDSNREEALNSNNDAVATGSEKFRSMDDYRYSDGGKYPVVQFRQVGSQGGTYLGESFRQIMTTPRSSHDGAMDVRKGNDDEIYLPRWDAVAGKIVYVNYSDSRYVDDRISSSIGIYPKFKADNDQTQPQIPKRALTGFTVVREDGMIYEYHLPVFNFCTKIMSRSKGHDDKYQRQYGDLDFGDVYSSNSMERTYAYSWLLTGVKSPDYVDIAPAGIDDNDLGSWVKFSYNSKIPVYHYRTPYKGVAPAGVAIDNQLNHESYYSAFGQASWGVKEIYYLTDITTPTHHAKLTLSNRNDGKESTELTSCDTFNIYNHGAILNLGDMVPEVGDTLIVDYVWRVASGPKIKGTNVRCIVSSIGNPINSTFSSENGSTLRRAVNVSGLSINTNATYYKGTKVVLKRNANNVKRMKKVDRIDLYARKSGSDDYSSPIKSVKFGYETNQAKQLCPKIPNSFDINGNEGKLTLRTVEVGIGNDFLPSYQFSYYMEGMDAPYNIYSWDRWGFYKKNGGMVNTTLKNVNIADWVAMLDTLKATNAGHLSYKVIVNGLQQIAPDHVDFITSNPSVNNLKDIYKMEIVDALTLAVNDINFYKNNKTEIDNIYQQGALYPYCQKWKEYATSGTNPVLLSDGSPRQNPVLQAWEINIINGFNLSLISELIYVKSNRSKIISEDDRIVLKSLDINRFDHNTNPDDVKAWSLRTIKMPSGAKVNIDLESDDYSYVGHVRAADPVAAEGIGTNASDLKDIGYYKRIGLEKDLISSNSMLKIKDWEEDKTETFTQDGNRAYKDVKLRASSLFRVYRNVGTAQNPHWQFNKDFEKFYEWWSEDTLKRNDSRYQLHLVALLDPFSYGSFIMNPLCIGCSKQDGYTSSNEKAFAHSMIPIDLGPITEPFRFYQITDNGSRMINEKGETVSEDSACQRRYAEFSLKDLTEDYRNWESKQLLTDPSHQCQITYSTKWMLYGCGDKQHTITLPSADKKGHFMYQLTWARKVDFNDTVDVKREIPEQLRALSYGGAFAIPCYMNRAITGNNTIMDVKQAAINGLLDMCYWDNQTKPDSAVRRGFLSWSFFDEYGWDLTYDYPIPDGANKDDFPFESNYWDFYSINSAVKIDEPDISAHVAGVPGGGIRVKKLVFNSGWPQRNGRLPQDRVIEYQYVCDAGNGKPGNFSSGATASVPPPYNNKGDDRNDQTPQTSLLTGSPSVCYGTIHEIRPGSGKIIHNYLTCADVGDFWADDSANYYYYNSQNKRLEPIKGAYNADPFMAFDYMNPMHRWRLNKCSQFQGLMISQEKYDQSGTLVSQNKIRYQTSMHSKDLCNLSTICRLNDVNPRIEGVLLPYDQINILTGSPNYKFGYHPLSDYMGCTVERYRMKWLCHLPEEGYTDPALQSYISYIEVEAVEHSAHQYEIQTTTYGVGKRSINAYYDFLTGAPLVVTELEAKEGTSGGCSSCGQTDPETETMESTVPAKTSVTVPAYWVDAYNNSSNDQTSMGPAINSLLNRDLQLDKSTVNINNLKNKNMLTQTYSNSVYSRLLPPSCMSQKCLNDNQLNGKSRYQYIKDEMSEWMLKLRDERPDAINDTNSLFTRTITTWDRFLSNAANSVWRKSKEIVLRAPMTNGKQIDHTVVPVSQIDYPWADPSTLSGNSYIIAKENTQYDSYGHVVEEKDANNSYVATFYDARSKGIYKSGTVLNARKNECSVLTFDEQDALPLPPEWTTSGSLVKTAFRSGEQSLQLSAGQSIGLSLPSLAKSNYVISFWAKKNSTCKLIVNNTEIGTFKTSTSGAQWQKYFKRLSVRNAMIARIEPVSQTVFIDDLRVYPEDAQVITITTNYKGLTTSYAGVDDVISFFDYDAYGRLIEKRDQDGIVISTQSQFEAK